MPDFDLKPDDYKVRGKDGRWFRRDDKRYLLIGLVMCAAALIFVFWNRDGFSPSILFGVTAVFACCAGIFIGNLLKDVY